MVPCHAGWVPPIILFFIVLREEFLPVRVVLANYGAPLSPAMSRLVIYGRIVDRPCLLDGVPILLAIINKVVLHSPLKLYRHRALRVTAAMFSQEELSEPDRSRNVSLKTKPD